jgi:ABC-type multidrug transport system ATPase subunit
MNSVSPSAMFPLRVSGLSLAFKRPLFSNVNLEVANGQFVTIMGENGSGKTLLIDTLMGYRQPARGEVQFWGKNFSENRIELNQKIAWVVSHKEDYPLGLSVERFFASISEFYPTWDWQLVRDLYRDFELDRKKNLSILSLGENSKVKLIKALAFKPELLILDELTANLSPRSREIILNALIKAFCEKKMSVLYVCHSSEEAVRLSDQILVLTKDGLLPRQKEI